MATFAVHLSGDSIKEQAQKLVDAYPQPRHYRISERVYLVRSDDISQNVAEKININGDEPQDRGVVFKLNASYYGFERRGMWEWLALGERTGG